MRAQIKMDRNLTAADLKRMYGMTVEPIPTEEGGGWVASYPELGRNVFLGDGETQEEAMKHLDEVAEEWLEAYRQRGANLPAPQGRQRDFSGKFLVRLPKSLHHSLFYQAEKNETSLNQWIIYLLSAASTSSAIEAVIHDSAQRIEKSLWGSFVIGGRYQYSGTALSFNEARVTFKAEGRYNFSTPKSKSKEKVVA